MFLAVDRLGRSGKIILKPRGMSAYTMIFPHRQDGLSDRRSHLHHTYNHKEVILCLH